MLESITVSVTFLVEPCPQGPFVHNVSMFKIELLAMSERIRVLH